MHRIDQLGDHRYKDTDDEQETIRDKGEMLEYNKDETLNFDIVEHTIQKASTVEQDTDINYLSSNSKKELEITI